MPVPALFGHDRIPQDPHGLTLDRLAVERGQLDALRGHHRDLAVLEDDDVARVGQDRGDVGCEEHLAAPEADDDAARAVLAGDEPVGRGARDDADGVGAPALGERLLHRVIEPPELLQVMLDQVGQDFGIGLRAKRVALGGEPLLDLEIVLEDPVVHDDETARTVGVGMGVLLGRPTVRRPPRVADADGAGDGTVAQDGLEGLETAGSAPDLELPVTAEDGDARRVVSPVFEPLQSLEDDPDRALVTDVPDDPAHR